ncbi:MAG TPA: hypothetical protein VM784_11675 [Actinomycetota bacterium]|nr:hypothetical protein [Actinomycetota bacterium]
MPRTGELCEYSGTYVDNHLHETEVVEGVVFPPCADGDTWWWHEDLPIVKQMRYEAARAPRPGGLRDLVRERMEKQGRPRHEIEEELRRLT